MAGDRPDDRAQRRLEGVRVGEDGTLDCYWTEGPDVCCGSIVLECLISGTTEGWGKADSREQAL
jgi:hypothetical protein